MRSRSILWYKLAALVLILALVVPVLAACGDDDEGETPAAQPAVTATAAPAKTPVAQPTAMPTPTAKPAATPTVSTEPIKLGVLASWSGAAALSGSLVDTALKVVEKQLEKTGGVNVGGVLRPIKLIKYDDGSQVANTVAGYKKLVQADGVSAVIYGGATASALTAASDAAEETRVPLFSVGSTPEDLSNRPYTIRCVYPNASDVYPMVADFIVNNLKPKTVGMLMGDLKETRDRGALFNERLQAAGIKIVYEQYVTAGTTDFSPYLTTIKMKNPDVLIADSGGPELFYVSIFKQMPELGGWGDIKLISSSGSSSGTALKMSGAEGTYHWVVWALGLSYPGAKEMEQAFMDVTGKPPMVPHAFMYYCPWVTIKAIELAGSDKPADIAKAARSGNLVWEAPGGTFNIKPNGQHTNRGQIMLFKDGKLIPPTQ